MNIKLKDLLQMKAKELSLTPITKPVTLNNEISSKYISRPGLALAGFFERFAYKRVQILGETEISYMQSMKDEDLYDRLKEVLIYDIPCFIVTKGLSVPKQMVFLAEEMKIAILKSALTTDKFFHLLRNYLEDHFAPTRTVHGTMIDVYGVGLLLTGKSGIGKSECALDLVERGHRIITDDAVKIKLAGENLIALPTNDFGHFMEIRGVGLIDVEKMFGIQAVGLEKQIDVQLELMPWQDNMDYERIGLSDNYVDILGVKKPIIYLPISPGKNVSVIIEVVAMNYILKTFGYDAAKVYTDKLQSELLKKTALRKKQISKN
ncbi:MAG: HPr(Ser) kinase/phosphatase [Candidatus Cloacimonetes bacterium]|nr:HPr(Ser) kinase/phosphatase [Candidatus Cloacimonadota bacterium]